MLNLLNFGRSGKIGPMIAASLALVALTVAPEASYADGLPDPGMQIERGKTASLVTDPQNDFLSPDGVTWGVVGKGVTDNGTVEHIDQLFATAQSVGMPIFVSPHYYYKHDHRWHFEGALEKLMHNIGMFDRAGPLTTEGFEGSGADWLAQYKPYIDDDKTVVTSPHKSCGP